MALRTTGGYAFSKSERDELDKMEKQVSMYANGLNLKRSWNPDRSKAGSQCEMQLMSLYPRYHQLVQDLLDKYGFMGARKKDSTRMSFGGKKVRDE
jgi:hypothetical protein